MMFDTARDTLLHTGHVAPLCILEIGGVVSVVGASIPSLELYDIDIEPRPQPTQCMNWRAGIKYTLGSPWNAYALCRDDALEMDTFGLILVGFGKEIEPFRTFFANLLPLLAPSSYRLYQDFGTCIPCLSTLSAPW